MIMDNPSSTSLTEEPQVLLPSFSVLLLSLIHTHTCVCVFICSDTYTLFISECYVINLLRPDFFLLRTVTLSSALSRDIGTLSILKGFFDDQCFFYHWLTSSSPSPSSSSGSPHCLKIYTVFPPRFPHISPYTIFLIVQFPHIIF